MLNISKLKMMEKPHQYVNLVAGALIELFSEYKNKNNKNNKGLTGW